MYLKQKGWVMRINDGRRLTILLVFSAVLCFLGCGGNGSSSSESDSGTDSGAENMEDESKRCTSDEQCDDALFCNGLETCDPQAREADEKGCVSAKSGPCLPDQTCDNGAKECLSCSDNPDADADGSYAIQCGGDDCDDSDANRYPGNFEVCDAEHHDEDCDLTTFGSPGLDAGENTDINCCNRAPDGMLSCVVNDDESDASVEQEIDGGSDTADPSDSGDAEQPNDSGDTGGAGGNGGTGGTEETGGTGGDEETGGKCGSAVVGDIIYVDDDADADGDGTSWETAYNHLQDALNDAQPHDQIWVAEGVYRPAEADGSRNLSIFLKKDVAVFGGFIGSETLLTERSDPVDRKRSVLSCDLNQNDSVSGGNPINREDNCYHVVVGTNGATLDGFAVVGGNANHDSTVSFQNGGGMYADEYDCLKIANVIFYDNLAIQNGGGVYFEPKTHTATMSDTLFFGNRARMNGGGLAVVESDLTMINVGFVGNTSVERNGGGLYIEDGNPTLINVVFSGNTATYGLFGRGGGLYTEADPTILNAVFSGNQSRLGGGLFVYTGTPIITNAVFAGNRAQHGGGLTVDHSATNLTMINATITGNVAAATPTTGTGGGVNCGNSPKASLFNAIVYENHAVGDRDEVGLGTGGVIRFSNSDIKGCSGSGEGTWDTSYGTDDGGNIDTDPQFRSPPIASGVWVAPPTFSSSTFLTTLTSAVSFGASGALKGKYVEPDTDDGRWFPIVDNTSTTINVLSDLTSWVAGDEMFRIYDLHLSSESVCIDSGDGDALPEDSFDVDGDDNTTERTPLDVENQLRTVDGPDADSDAVVDMGAYEYQGD